jgi:AraC-like DNA-binding protein
VECNGIKEEVHKGDVFFIEKGVPHTYYAIGKTFSTQWVTFDGDGVSHILSYYGIDRFFVLKNTDTNSLTDQLTYLNTKASSNINEAELSTALYDLIVRLFSTRICTNINKHFEKCIKYINSTYAKCITLDDLAEISAMNKYTFCREFKSVYSITAFEYILRIRIQQAKKLLAETNLTVFQIAENTGFNDTGYFCRIFKRTEGVTPSHFRENNKSR